MALKLEQHLLFFSCQIYAKLINFLLTSRVVLVLARLLLMSFCVCLVVHLHCFYICLLFYCTTDNSSYWLEFRLNFSLACCRAPSKFACFLGLLFILHIGHRVFVCVFRKHYCQFEASSKRIINTRLHCGRIHNLAFWLENWFTDCGHFESFLCFCVLAFSISSLALLFVCFSFPFFRDTICVLHCIPLKSYCLALFTLFRTRR